MILYHYPLLPDRIPAHFGFSGEADAWGNKSGLLLQSGIVLVLYIGLSILNRFPYIFNYPVEITPDNFRRQYRMARTLLNILKLSSVLLFLGILYTTLRHAYGQEIRLMGGYMILVVPGLLILPLIIYLVAAINRKQESEI